MNRSFQILSTDLLNSFEKRIDFDVLDSLGKIQKAELPTEYFAFYRSVSSVYSARIEGEEIDFDSFFKHKFLKVEYATDYTARTNDLYSAYEFIDGYDLSLEGLKQAHAILSRNMLPKAHQGALRKNPMFVINNEERIEYVAADCAIIEKELSKLFADIDKLLLSELSLTETFFFAALIHLVFVKIHPFQDGNGRSARLLEKWFLISKIGKNAVSIQLEKNYYLQRSEYYTNIRKLGLEYETLNYNTALDFLLMTVFGLKKQLN